MVIFLLGTDIKIIVTELDILAASMVRLKNNSFFEWTQRVLARPGRTVEFNILNRRIIMTDDRENIKTIFATNVG